VEKKKVVVLRRRKNRKSQNDRTDGETAKSGTFNEHLVRRGDPPPSACPKR